VGLVQLIRFLVLKLTYIVSNPRFDMVVVFTANYFLVGDNVFIDNELLLMIDFINLKIKQAQSFKGTHKNRMCVCVYMDECSYVYEYLRLYCVSKKILRMVKADA
jgi:hypothetical protein